MAKNITIAEGGVSRNFTAKKLKTNLQGGGNCTWIPEDEAADYCTFKELTVRQNGTYKAEDKNCDGFDKVKVEVASDVLPQKTITQNGEYDAVQDDGRAGYAHVTVNVPGGGGGPFTVLFLDDEGNLIKKQADVPYGGYASCTALDGTVRNGLYFKGWNPVPKNVQFNMTCQPVRGDYQIIANEILDDWETIVADGGAHYPLGSYKTLIMQVPAHPDFAFALVGQTLEGEYKNLILGDDAGATIPDFPIVSITCHMVKVAEGEDGSTSSWISDGFINFDGIDFKHFYDPTTSTTYEIRADWLNHPIRKWLNEDLFAALPLPLKNAIVNVNKTTKAGSTSPAGNWAQWGVNTQLVDKTSIDGIWIPSMREFHTTFSALNWYGQGGYAYSEELQGVDYSSVFSPIVSSGTRLTFRTQGSWSGTLAHIEDVDGTEVGDDDYYGWQKSIFGFCL